MTDATSKHWRSFQTFYFLFGFISKRTKRGVEWTPSGMALLNATAFLTHELVLRDIKANPAIVSPLSDKNQKKKKKPTLSVVVTQRDSIV